MRRTVLLAFVLVLLLAGRADAASLTLTSSADPVQDVAMSISVSGTVTGASGLYVFASPADAPCAATAVADTGADLTRYAKLGSGAFQRTYTYTPSAATTFTICAYLTNDAWSTPDVVARSTFTPRRPHATLTLAPPVVLDGLSAVIDVSGTSEAPRFLYVHASRDAACPATASAGSGVDLTPGGFMLLSPFTEPVPLLMPAGGTWLVCAYLAQSPTATPDAVAGTTVVDGLAADDTPDDDEIPTPVPVLLGPDDGAAQAGFAPDFTWTRWLDGDESDTLVLARREPDGTTATLLTLDDEASDSYRDDAGEAAEIDGDTKDMATYATDMATVSVQLKRPLPPATYVWSVEREDVTSESRTFTVLGAHVAHLRATVRSSRGRTSKYPGSSTLHVTTSASANVRVALHRQGRVGTLSFTADAHGHVDVAVPWSCAHPGGAYRYVVQASDQYGARLTKSGSFAPVTPERCRSLKRREAAARRGPRRRRAEQQAADRRATAEHAAAAGRLKDRCTALGGTPVAAAAPDGPALVCRSPLGGLLNVPL